MPIFSRATAQAFYPAHKLFGIFGIIIHGFAIQVFSVIPDNALPLF